VERDRDSRHVHPPVDRLTRAEARNSRFGDGRIAQDRHRLQLHSTASAPLPGTTSSARESLPAGAIAALAETAATSPLTKVSRPRSGLPLIPTGVPGLDSNRWTLRSSAISHAPQPHQRAASSFACPTRAPGRLVPRFWGDRTRCWRRKGRRRAGVRPSLSSRRAWRRAATALDHFPRSVTNRRCRDRRLRRALATTAPLRGDRASLASHSLRCLQQP